MSQDVLRRLLDTARDGRRADEVWPVAAAAIEVLWWHERFTDAWGLAENTITRFRQAPGSLLDHDMPFDEAVVLGAAENGDDPGAAVARLGEVVAAESVLGKRLNWLSEALPGRNPHSLLSGCDSAVSRPAIPLKKTEAELAERDPASLTSGERRRLWVAARRSQRPDIVLRMYDGGVGPRDWLNAFWLSRQLVHADRTAEATMLLIESLDLWFAEKPWHVTPTGIVIQPDMRTAVTPELRQVVLDNVDVQSVPGIQR